MHGRLKGEVKFLPEEYAHFLSLDMSLRPVTINGYLLVGKRFFLWLGDGLFSYDKCREYIFYLKQKNLSYSSIDNFRNFCSTYCKFLNMDNFAPNLPKSKRKETEINILSIEEIKSIIDLKLNYRFNKDEANEFYRLFYLMLAHGRRISEVTRLKVKHIDFGNDAVYLDDPKNGKARWLPIPKHLSNDLKKWCKNKNAEDHVFTYSRIKGKVNTSTIRVDLAKRTKKLKIKKRVYPHLFRHSFPVALLKMNVPLPLVSELLTHSDYKITKRYTHLVLDDLRSAINLHPLNQTSITPDEIITSLKRDLKKYKNGVNLEIIEKKGEFTVRIVY